jgi:hypothetical protein
MLLAAVVKRDKQQEITVCIESEGDGVHGIDT